MLPKSVKSSIFIMKTIIVNLNEVLAMAEKIFPKKIKGITYYYYQYTYREKINPTDNKKGKGPGSGKS